MGYYEQSLQRKQEIEEGLLSLMRETPYAQITVKDLTERLCIARKTFYHYFPGKGACLESLTDRLICECNLSVLRTLPAEAGTDQVYRARLEFWMGEKPFLDAIIKNGMGSFLLERFLRYLREEDKSLQDRLSTPEVGYDEDILFFYMSGQLFLLLKWCHDGFVLSLEEMVQKYLRLVHEPLLPPDE